MRQGNILQHRRVRSQFLPGVSKEVSKLAWSRPPVSTCRPASRPFLDPWAGTSIPAPACAVTYTYLFWRVRVQIMVSLRSGALVPVPTALEQSQIAIRQQRPALVYQGARFASAGQPQLGVLQPTFYYQSSREGRSLLFAGSSYSQAGLHTVPLLSAGRGSLATRRHFQLSPIGREGIFLTDCCRCSSSTWGGRVGTGKGV